MKTTLKTDITVKDIWKGALAAAKQIEAKYGEESLWHESDFEWGHAKWKSFCIKVVDR